MNICDTNRQVFANLANFDYNNKDDKCQHIVRKYGHTAATEICV